MHSSGIPENRHLPKSLTPQQCDIRAFEDLRLIKNEIFDFVKEGDNLYIYSATTGNGKTSWAIKMMHKYFDEIWSGNGFRTRALFIHVPLFMKKLREQINNPTDEFHTLQQLIPQVDLVVWDDISACTLKDYDHLNILSLIDERSLNCKSNIYTGNLGGDKLAEAIGQRLRSRVYESALKVELKGIDRRGLV